MKFLYLISIVLILASCGKNNPNPAWLEVNEWALVANPNQQYPTGELTHNFSDAYVMIDGEVIGYFEVPFKIPILKSGTVNIQIFPVIRNNGIAATKKIYPFVEKYELNAELVQNQTLTINPTTQYISYTNFPWIEDFEGNTLSIYDDPNSASSIYRNNNPAIVKYGSYYGQVDLNAVDSTWIAYTMEEMALPRGVELYMEIDYYNTNNLITGVLAISSSSVVNNQNVQLNAQDPTEVKWKKMYIDLKEIVSYSTSAAYFEQSFQAQLDPGDATGTIIIDNVKVVHL